MRNGRIAQIRKVHGPSPIGGGIFPHMNAQTPIETAPGSPRKLQIRGALSDALDLIAYQGLTQRDAAARAGMHEVALSKALKKPHIKAEVELRKEEAAMSLATLKGISRISAYRVGIDLMHNSPDHKVRAKMVELFTGEARQPTVAVQINQHAGSGYIYNKPDNVSDQDAAQPIDVTPQGGKPA